MKMKEMNLIVNSHVYYCGLFLYSYIYIKYDKVELIKDEHLYIMREPLMYFVNWFSERDKR